MSKTSLDKSKIRFLLLEGVHQNAVDTLKAAGYTNIEYLTGSLPEAELKEKIADAHFIGIRSRTQLTEEIFDCAKKLVAVGCFCIGTNQVDLEAARARGIAVFNAPYSNTRSVAELVLAEAILLLRGIPEKNASCHRGGWIKSAANSFEIRGKKLGIVGYGSIGTQLSVLAENMGMQVYFFDPLTKLPLGNAVQVTSLNELLGLADIVSLHVPELPSTQWMIGEKEIRSMKKGAILINAARGTVVELDHLAAAIKDKHLIGAAIDVFPVEPRSNDEEFESPLRGLDNVILTPHIGVPPPKPRPTSAWKWPRNWSSTATTVLRCPRSTSQKWPCRLTQANTVCCTSTKTSRACSARSTRSSPRTVSTSPVSSCRPTRKSVTW